MTDAGYRPEPIEPPSMRVVSIPLYLVLTLVTCGLFNLYWNYRQMVACNAMLGRREFSWLVWFLLTLVTIHLMPPLVDALGWRYAFAATPAPSAPR